MSPFDLNGPTFLLFYFVFGIVVCLVLRRAIAHNEAAGAWAPPRNDPYLIAFLRAGAAESVKLAVVALIDRGLLLYKNGVLTLARADADQFVQRDIERAVIKRCSTAVTSDAVLVGAPRMAACEAYRAELIDGGFLVGPEMMQRRWPPVLLAIGLLIAVAAIKVAVAFARGRFNVLILLIMLVVFCAIAAGQRLPDSTGRGKVALANLRTLFARLRTRAPRMTAGGETNEMALLAAVFGFAALPAGVFPYVQQMVGPRPGGDSSSSTGSDSSGCGSSDGGGSSGCGGGGGCGGCGS
jgi:uncharacterized protein (TIGR04222 family)